MLGPLNVGRFELQDLAAVSALDGQDPAPPVADGPLVFTDNRLALRAPKFHLGCAHNSFPAARSASAITRSISAFSLGVSDSPAPRIIAVRSAAIAV